jgi:L-fuculose-phosphate aldolase
MGYYEELAVQRAEVAYFMRRLYDKDLTSCSGGNISVRASGDLVLITPSSLDKGELAANQVVLVDLSGENLSPELRPTIEMGLHLEIYRRRPDVKAVVHAHPVFATSFSCMGLDIEIGLTPEGIMTVGELARAEYHPAGTEELAAATAEALASANVAVMTNHGVVAAGPSLFKAYDRLEVTEIAAKMTWITSTMNKCNPLDASQRATINTLMGL